MPSSRSYPVEVQSDFLEKITKASPIQAVAEFVWNSLDADAAKAEVLVRKNKLGVASEIIIRDNGTGIEYTNAPELFKNLGGSWKRMKTKTKDKGRSLHGRDGRGRFKVFALGGFAEWNVTYSKGKGLFNFVVKMTIGNMKQVVISEEKKSTATKPGTTLTISNLFKDYRSIDSEAGVQELTEIFAIYLSDYKDASISVGGTRIDPSTLIASRQSVHLKDIVEAGKSSSVELDIIEWHTAANRALYLCNDKGFPLIQVERRFHVGPFQFSAYLKSAYISKLQKEGLLELAEMNPILIPAIVDAQAALKEHFRGRAAHEAKTVVAEWKEERVYPYEGEPVTQVEQVERQVFDIVAVNVAQYLPDFSDIPSKNKALHLRLLRQAIEKSPEDLQLILGEVLALPKRKQEELAELLRDVSLSAIISAAKVVADRLKFLTGLEAILFDKDLKNSLKERSQLHRIVAQNSWLFGEEFNLSVNDKSLTEVLKKHRELLGNDSVIDEPVKHVSKKRGIVDLVLSRAIRRHRADELTHLVVELKAPKVKIDKDAITQIEGYAISVMEDERFKSLKTTWVFWAISDDYGKYAEHRMKTYDNGKIHDAESVSIWVKTWAQVLEENRARLQFFQERLEYQADSGASLKHLREHYADFLNGVLLDEPVEPLPRETKAKGRTTKVDRKSRKSS